MTIEAAWPELSKLLGDRITRSKSELETHGASESYFPLTLPDAVAYPENTQEVSALVTICAAHSVPVIGWGAGTSLEGQAQAFQGGICVDFSRMNRILEVSQGDMDARVQPGLTREVLNEELRATGLFFPVDPGANASIGGMASTRASGTTAVRYGTMRDNVLGLEVVLADGRVIRTGTRARKSSAGYDLTGLFVGAEGTLGLITELTLRLHGQPEAVTSAVCAFDTIGDAVRAVTDAIQMGIPMARVEFVDAATVQVFNEYAGAGMPEAPHLLLEFHGSPTSVAEDAESFGEIVADHQGHGFQWASGAEERKALWTLRHHAYWAILQTRPGTRAVVTDICVPISRLAEAVEATQADLDAQGIRGPILGHVGDGNFHAILLFDPDDTEELARVKAAADRLVDRALSMGGTATGEHGIGTGKKVFMAREHGDAWGVMGDIKRSLDPHNLMNPGKMVPDAN
ncbi:FAD-binding oxidoreductase [Pseudooceanicola nitratireducens]|jgi:D-lactate dehydrogenase (cytochrome)|uniref:D-lactate dehydrogenase (cytochrome) n=1 Tax=Pseudooceanicola nitratireducens TaxID=517719 RepID=A0A1I1N0S7_9RHOB|nr:FAD-linked oxidase C-terminal domain-containing protein [Pseudooceanicola nitratireducens]MEC7299764.1 FAD-linked oxidase C-terminal domain-containing protein [Pseudomonadota bacterium]SEI81216.1 D-lactate dehydrogenase (cytochrome) [Pseudooceanicola nitratireducens]SFC88443.1 D-lactate dehydrogenase (cytochrome) [Pseudooceanicola nitratireducens]